MAVINDSKSTEPSSEAKSQPPLKERPEPPATDDCSLLDRLRHNPKFLLTCLCFAGLIQGMIFTNVVISSLERRFGLDSTQSGVVVGAYDLGNLLAVVPVTYFGGRPTSSKPKYIASGMALISLGSLIFSLPHFVSNR